MFWRIANLAVLAGAAAAFVALAVTRPAASFVFWSVIAMYVIGALSLEAFELGRGRRAALGALVALALLAGVALVAPLAAGCFVFVAPVVWLLERRTERRERLQQPHR